MTFKKHEELIDKYWDKRSDLDKDQKGELTEIVIDVISALDSGELRVAEKKGKDWKVNQWAKKAILFSFQLNEMKIYESGQVSHDMTRSASAFEMMKDIETMDAKTLIAQGVEHFGTMSCWFDKVDSKFNNWDIEEFEEAGFRAVPGCIVRRSAYIAKNVVLMPSFVNVGAYVDEGTMVDTWATIGSCAQIGKNCHISGGTGIGGVLEPLQANPVIIEDNVFIGARSEIAEGVIVEEGSVISMGVFIGASTKIVDRDSGEIFYGRVPAGSVAVPGSMPNNKKMKDGSPAPHLYCAVIVKQVDDKTRSKTSINEILRGV